jgi:hypothetical protein
MLVVAVVDITTLMQALARVQMVLGAVVEQMAEAVVQVRVTTALAHLVVQE